MTLYKYSAFTDAGQTVQGEIEAVNEKTAKNQLQMKGVFVSNIYNAENAFSFESLRNIPLRDILSIEIGSAKIPQREIVIFSRQFATLIDAGIPIIQSLDSLIDQIEHRPLLRIVRKIRTDVNEGSSLFDAMSKHQRVFGDLYVNMVQAAEVSGRLGSVLSEMSNMLEEKQALSGEIKSAMTYPVVMIVVGLAVVSFMLTSVVPNITSMFDGTGAELPKLTQIMLSVSDFLQSFGLILIAFFAILFWVTKQMIARYEACEMVWNQVLFRLPVFGALAKKTALARFTSTLSVLLKSGVPILTSLKITENVTPFLLYKKAIEQVALDVKEGSNLGDSLKKTQIFPSIIINMVSIGEKSGQLEKMLERMSLSMSSDLKVRLKGLSSLIQPLLLLILGGLIAFIMGAVLLPIFELNSIAGGV